jgi:hypothetical protein
MVDHDALAYPGLARLNVFTHCNHDTAWLMACDLWFGVTEAQFTGSFAWRCAVELQVTAAHARGFDFQNNLVWTGCWVVEVLQLDLFIAGKDCTFHDVSPKSLFVICYLVKSIAFHTVCRIVLRTAAKLDIWVLIIPKKLSSELLLWR